MDDHLLRGSRALLTALLTMVTRLWRECKDILQIGRKKRPVKKEGQSKKFARKNNSTYVGLFSM